MTETKKNWGLRNWGFWISSIVVIFFAYSFVVDYIRTGRSVYGTKANELRLAKGIPIIEEYMKPESTPRDKHDGIRWGSKRKPTANEFLIHKWKIVAASESDGWNEEDDAFLYFIDDTTSFQLNTKINVFKDSITISGKLGKVDNRKDEFEDYLENKYPSYDWLDLNKAQLDSVIKYWKIVK